MRLMRAGLWFGFELECRGFAELRIWNAEVISGLAEIRKCASSGSGKMPGSQPYASKLGTTGFHFCNERFYHIAPRP